LEHLDAKHVSADKGLLQHLAMPRQEKTRHLERLSQPMIFETHSRRDLFDGWLEVGIPMVFDQEIPVYANGSRLEE
jgi:hypothetical protein